MDLCLKAAFCVTVPWKAPVVGKKHHLQIGTRMSLRHSTKRSDPVNLRYPGFRTSAFDEHALRNVVLDAHPGLRPIREIAKKLPRDKTVKLDLTTERDNSFYPATLPQLRPRGRQNKVFKSTLFGTISIPLYGIGHWLHG